MASSLNGTGVTFNDGSQLATAAPQNSQIGGFIMAWLITSSPNSGTYVFNYAAEYTVAGSSLAYNMTYKAQSAGPYYYPFAPISKNVGSASAQTFPANNGTVVGNYGYSTISGSWRAVNGFSVLLSTLACCNYNVAWYPAIWQRYA
jgi:hypothetical protein